MGVLCGQLGLGGPCPHSATSWARGITGYPNTPPAPGPPLLLSSSSSSSRCPTTSPLCPSLLAHRGWWVAVPQGCWPCPEHWLPRLSWPRLLRRTGQVWRLRGPEVSGWGRVALARGCGGWGEDWQTTLPRAPNSHKCEVVAGPLYFQLTVCPWSSY